MAKSIQKCPPSITFFSVHLLLVISGGGVRLLSSRIWAGLSDLSAQQNVAENYSGTYEAML